jgi:hypothetical protein
MAQGFAQLLVVPSQVLDFQLALSSGRTAPPDGSSDDQHDQQT